MTNREHRKFMARTRSSYASHKRRANEAGAQIDYDLDRLRQQIAWQIGKPCPYCGNPITIKTFSADHRTPTSRGGSYLWENIQIIDTRCNQVKGTLTAAEFTAFLADLAKLPEPVAKNIMARMRAGAALIRS